MKLFIYFSILLLAACSMPFDSKKTEIEIEASKYDEKTGYVHIETSASDPLLENMEIVIPFGTDKRIGLLKNVKTEEGGWFGSDNISFDVYIPPSMKEDLLPQLAKDKKVVVRGKPAFSQMMRASVNMNRDTYIRQMNLTRHSDQLKAMLEPAHNLIPTPRLIANPGSSKMGGMPNLPAKVQWPVNNGKPMAFIMQLKLSDFHSSDEMKNGYLFLFMDLSEAANDTSEYEPWDVAYRIIYHPGAELLTEFKPFPSELTRFEQIDETALRHSTFPMLPDLQSASARRLGLSETEESSYIQLRAMFETAAFTDIFNNARNQGTHRFLGYPETGTDLQLYAEMDDKGVRDSIDVSDKVMNELTDDASKWRLLMQVDFDYSPMAASGLSGKYYFMIKKKDLEKKKYEEAVMYFESWE